jgi:hypothetical protein
VNLMVQIIASTNDLTPLYWLNARFLADDNMRRAAAVEKIHSLLPEIVNLLADAGMQVKARR